MCERFRDDSLVSLYYEIQILIVTVLTPITFIDLRLFKIFFKFSVNDTINKEIYVVIRVVYCILKRMEVLQVSVIPN